MDVTSVFGSGDNLNLARTKIPYADAFNPGLLNTGSQDIPGIKNFVGGIVTEVIVTNTFVTSNLQLPSLSPNSAVLTDSSGTFIAGLLDLNTQATGNLPVIRGGTGSTTAIGTGKFMISNSGSITESSIDVLSPTFNTISSTTASFNTLNSNSLNIVGNANFASLSPNMVVFTDASRNLISGTIGAITIDLTSQVFNVLPIANGGTNSNTALNGGMIMISLGGKIVESTKSYTDPTFNTVNVSTNLTANAAAFNNLVVATVLNASYLTASLPVLTNASKNLVSGLINLTSMVTGVLPIANGGTNSSTALNNNRMVWSSAGRIVEAGALTNGQLFIGNTGNAPIASSITQASANQVLVVNGPGSITLSLPQDINTTSSPTFNGLTLSGTLSGTILSALSLTLSTSSTFNYLTANMPILTNASKNLVSGQINLSSMVTGTLPVLNGGTGSSTALAGGRLMVSTTTQIIEGTSATTPSFVSVTTTSLNASGTVNFGSLTASLPVLTNGSSNLVSGSINLATMVTGILTVANGGTGSNVALTNGNFMISSLGKIVESTISYTNPSFNSIVITSSSQLSFLTASQPVLTDASKNLVSGFIDLTTMVTGVLSVTNGGTGSSTALTNGKIIISAGGVMVEGPSSSNPSFTSVTATGALSGSTLTISTQATLSYLTASRPILSDASNNLVSGLINLTTMVTGTLPVANGGTNSSTALTNNKLMVSSGGRIQEGTSSSDPVFTSITSTNLTASGNIVFGQLSPNQYVATDGTGKLVSASAGAITINLATQVTGILPIANGGTGSSTAVGTGKFIVSDTNKIVESVISITDPSFTTVSTNGLTVATSATFSYLSANSAVITDSSSNIISGQISLTSMVTGILPIVNGGTNSNTTLTNGRLMWSSGSRIVEATALTNGQFFIGSTGVAPVAATLTGTANQVIVTNGPGSITLSLPQNIGTTSSPTFDSITITNTFSATTLAATNLGGINLTVMTSANFDYLTANQPVVTDASKNLVSGLINLSSMVTDTLPVANGGTGSSTAVTTGKIMISSSGTIVESSVNIATPSFTSTTTGSLTVSGITTLSALSASTPVLTNASSQLVSGLISLATMVTGTLPVANGGTGSSTAVTSNKLMISSGGSIVESAISSTTPSFTSITIGSSATFNYLTASSAIITDASKNIISGQINLATMVTGTLPVANGGTGSSTTVTNNKIIISSSGTIVESAIDIASPSFTTVNATNLNVSTNANFAYLTASRPIVTDASKNLVSSFINLTSMVTGILPVANGGTNSSTALTNNQLMWSSGGQIVEGGALTNGQLFIGNTGNAPTKAAITGTTNQVNVTNGAGSITLSLPQNIHTAATPTFNRITLTENVAMSITAPNGLFNYLATDFLGVTTNLQMTFLTANMPILTDNSKYAVSGFINLTSMVTGILPLANGGTNSSSSLTGGRLMISSATQILESTISSTTPSFTSMTLTATINQLILGTTNTVTINSTAPAASRTYTLPDTSANSSFVMTDSAQTLNGIKTHTSQIPITTTSNQLVFGSGTTVTFNITTSATRIYSLPDAGANANFVMTEGAQTINGIKTYSSQIPITATTNQLVLGTTNTTTISSTAPAASRTYTIPDAGTNSSFIMADSAQTINGIKTFTSQIINTTTSNQLVLGTTNTTTISSVAPAASRTYTIPDAGTNSSFIMADSAQTVNGIKTFSSQVRITPTTNQILLGTTNTVTISSTAPAASRTYTIPDAGANANVLLDQGANTIAGTWTFSAAPTIRAPYSLQLVGVTPSGSPSLAYGTYITSLAAGTSTISFFTINVASGTGTVPIRDSTTGSISAASFNGTATTNQIVLGTTNTVTISSTAPAASRTYTIPDAGANTSFILAASNQTLSGIITFSNTTDSTAIGNGGVILSGGLSVAKQIRVNTGLILSNSTYLQWKTAGGIDANVMIVAADNSVQFSGASNTALMYIGLNNSCSGVNIAQNSSIPIMMYYNTTVVAQTGNQSFTLPFGSFNGNHAYATYNGGASQAVAGTTTLYFDTTVASSNITIVSPGGTATEFGIIYKGYYSVSATCEITAGADAYLTIHLNDSPIYIQGRSTTTTFVSISGAVYCNGGDIIKIRVVATAGTVSSSFRKCAITLINRAT